MANKISVVIDVAVDRANRGIKSFQQSVKDADGAVGKFKAGSSAAFASLKANAGVAAVAVGASLVKLGANATNAASDLEQSIGGVEKAFGSASESILKIGESAAESMGLSQRAFNEGALALSAFAEDIASDTGEPVEKVITDLMTRAADFAAAYGTTVPEAVRIFSSTLSGESEPIKRFGIIVNETETKAYAAEAGIEGMGKATQRAGLLMRDTNKFAGQFAEESGTLAGQQERLGAELENLMATLGEGLTPVVADATKVIRQLMDLLQRAGDNQVVETGNKLGVFNNIFGATLDMWDRGPGSLIAFMNAEKNAADATDELTVATSEHTSEMTVAREASDGLTRATDSSAVSLQGSTAAIEANRAALDKLIDRQEAARGAQMGVVGARVDDLEANDELIESIIELTEAQGDGNEMDQERTAMARTLVSDMQRKAQAAADLAEEEAIAAGAAFDSNDKHRIYQATLNELRDGTLPQLEGKVREYVDSLTTIPKYVGTTFNTNFTSSGFFDVLQKRQTLQTRGGPHVFGATGGIVTRPTLATIGEAGPEAVIPLNKTPGSSPLPSGLAGPGPIYLTVNAGLGTDGRDVGRLIVEELQKHQRRNGPGSLP